MSAPRFTFPSRHSTLAAAVLVVAGLGTGPLSAQSQFTDLGCALPGAAGPPVLSGTGSLVTGSPGSVNLDQAAPNALALLFLSLDENPTRFKGGVLKPVPSLPFPVLVTTAGGELDLPFVWPSGVPETLPFYMQYAVQDAGAVAGVALSNALRGVTPGPALIDGLSSTQIDVNGLLTVSGVNLGDDANDVCILLHQDGQTVGFSRAQIADGNSVTTLVGALRPGSTTAQLVLNTGDGAIIPAVGLPPGITVQNGGSWVFSGDAADMVVFDQELDLFSFGGQDTEGTGAFYQYLYSTMSSQGWMEIVMPQGDCPPGTTMSFQLDACTESGSLGLDYYVGLENNGTLTALECATLICQQFQLAVFNKLGVLLTCIPVQSGSDVILRVLPPVNQTWKSWSGAYFSVCFPATSCTEYYGSPLSASTVQLDLPVSVPDGAAATVYFGGLTALGSYAWAYDSLIMPAGPATPLQLATAAANLIQTAFNDQGVPASAFATLVSGTAVIQVWAPFLDSWADSFLYLEICDLQ